jgi:CDGSH-type Zn-finger protein
MPESASDLPPVIPPLTIRVRPNGPLVIDGPVRVVDQHGNEFRNPSAKPNIALCRCGHSAKKPFCDGSHNTCGFVAAETAG